MASQYDNILQLTSDHLSDADRWRRLGSFAHELGWRPSDRLDEPRTRDLATVHLLVEHGLENTAVVSFLRRPRRWTEVGTDGQQRLLSLSYNNLVDWHVMIEAEAVSYVYVRTRVPTTVERHALSIDRVDQVRSEIFEQIIDKKPNPNIPALDEALIRTISVWKRSLAAELNYQVKNVQLSSLFNALMFVRALEDQRSRERDLAEEPMLLRLMDVQQRPLGSTLGAAFQELVGQAAPADLIDAMKLAAFDALSKPVARSLVADFYNNRFAPYPYDFCVMSKHALSRIYEHYVSILRVEDSPQLSLLPPLPEEITNKVKGAVYTPHFIARFFARFLKEQLPPSAYRTLKSADPACGSGIFLRTLLESQAEVIQDAMGTEYAALFEGVLGVDEDPNAVDATRLSLALLHLALTGTPPKHLEVLQADALSYITEHRNEKGSRDAVLANPPFVSLDTQSEELRRRVVEYLGDSKLGRNDLYLAFLKVGLELLRPGGFGLFVLPHSFLLGKSAQHVREMLAQQAWVRCLVDLSTVDVFGDVGAYVVLLIFQKKLPHGPEPAATIVRVSERAGRALQDTLDGRRIEGKSFSIYDVGQSEFGSTEWLLLPPRESALRRRLEACPLLSEFLDVKQGIVTGSDDIFIRHVADVPKGESAVYLPLLRDRDMAVYSVPRDSELRVFHPFKKGKALSESELRKQFPRTWAYLVDHKRELQARKSLARYRKQWWEPMWPRPESIQRPKIIAPHLVLMPRFSVDLNGRFAVSHGPMLLSRTESAAENELLKFFCAALNSSAAYWHIARHSHTYRRGYVMLEPKTLKGTPVPDPAKIDKVTLRAIIKLVDERMSARGETPTVDRRLDNMFNDLYGLSDEDRRLVGSEAD